MQNEPYQLTAKIDPEVGQEFLETVEREQRTKVAVIERALRDYIARSKREAHLLQTAEQQA